MNFSSIAKLFLSLLVTAIVGCDIPQRPPVGGANRSPVADPPSTAQGREILEPPGGVFEPWEAWDVFYAESQPVGYAHLVAELANPIGGNSTARYRLQSEFLVQRGDATIRQRLNQLSTETPEGRLKEFESILHVGPAATEIRGAVKDDQLQIETVRGTVRLKRTVPWESTYRGLVALEQSLRRSPMTERGDVRALTMLLPGQYELGTARLACRGLVSIPTLHGTPVEAIEIDVETQQGDLRPVYSTIWTDKEGHFLRTYSVGLGLFVYRTDQQAATDWMKLNAASASITVRGNVSDPTKAKRCAFVIRPRQGSQIEIKPAPGQFVRTLDDGTMQVLVSIQKEIPTAGFEFFDSEVTDADREPNYFIDSNDTSIRQLNEVAVNSRQMDRRQIAVELAQTLQRTTDRANQSEGWSKASQVWLRRVGDATGRAILMAAMLRANDIPSRVALGFRFDRDDPQKMNYHAWTLAHIDDQWVVLDVEEGGFALADRITFVITDLGGSNEQDNLIRLLNAAASIEVDVVGQR